MSPAECCLCERAARKAEAQQTAAQVAYDAAHAEGWADCKERYTELVKLLADALMTLWEGTTYVTTDAKRAYEAAMASVPPELRP